MILIDGQKTGKSMLAPKPVEKPDPIDEMSKRFIETVSEIQKQNNEVLEKIAQSMDAIQKKEINFPQQDKELTDFITKLPGIIKEINDKTSRQFASLFEGMVEIVKARDATPVVIENKMDRPKEYTIEATDFLKDGRIKKATIKVIE